MLDKRGQGLSTNAIILIILGVVVLIVLILGFTMGWNKILPFVSTNNVENIKTACNVACSTSGVYDFCTQERTLKADDLAEGEITATCDVLSQVPYTQYGIAECASIVCEE